MAETTLKWKYNAGASIRSNIVTDSSGAIYFGTRTTKIIALNSDGTLKWEFGGSFYYITGLALSNDESVLFVVDASNDVYALYTATGVKKWGYGVNHGDTEKPGLSGIVRDSNDNIYVGGWDSAYSIYSVDYGGNFRWKTAGDDSHSGLIIGKSDTVVYYQDEQGLHEVQLSDGTVNWDHQGTSWGSDGTGISIADDGTIHYGDFGYFYAINSNGSEKWNFAVTSNPGTNNAIGSNGNIWFVDRNPGIVIVANSSGSEVWRYDLPSWVGSGFAATGLVLDSNDVVYAGCADNKLYALNSDGTLRWTYTAGNDVLSGIAFNSTEDTVYFGCDDGYLYAVSDCGKIVVGDKVFLLPIGNFAGDLVALKSGNAAITDKTLIAPLDEQATRKLAFRNCQSSVNDKVVCIPIGNTKKDLLAVR